MTGTGETVGRQSFPEFIKKSNFRDFTQNHCYRENKNLTIDSNHHSNSLV